MSILDEIVEGYDIRWADYFFEAAEDSIEGQFPRPHLLPNGQQALVAWLRDRENGNPSAEGFNLELLRESVEWAEKSAQLGSVNGIEWQQNTWARLFNVPEELLAQGTSYRNLPFFHAGGAEVFSLPIETVKEGFCGTQGCIAGNIAMEYGEVLWEKGSNGQWGAAWVKADNSVGIQTIDDFAGNKLGFTRSEQSLFFAGENTLPDLAFYAEGFCERRGVTF